MNIKIIIPNYIPYHLHLIFHALPAYNVLGLCYFHYKQYTHPSSYALLSPTNSTHILTHSTPQYSLSQLPLACIMYSF